MIRLTVNDSIPRIKDAVERHLRLCMQNPTSATKYKELIQPLFADFEEKRIKLEELQKEVVFAKDAIKFNDKKLDNVLRDLNGRAKEFDCNNLGAKTAVLLFPNGNFSGIVKMADDKEPDVAHSIAQKVISLGEAHELFPFAAKIEEAVTDCRTALGQHKIAQQNAENAKTALSISKVTIIEQYNANYFQAATDVSKDFAESLFPKLNSGRKKKSITESTAEEKEEVN